MVTPHEHLKRQRGLQKEIIDLPLVAPPGTDTLPLAERLHIYLHVFESGCSVSQPPQGDGKPETCSECVRAFVDAVKRAVAEHITADPMNAALNAAAAGAGEWMREIPKISGCYWYKSRRGTLRMCRLDIWYDSTNRLDMCEVTFIGENSIADLDEVKRGIFWSKAVPEPPRF